MGMSTVDVGAIPVLVALKDGPPQEDYYTNKQSQAQADRENEDYQSTRVIVSTAELVQIRPNAITTMSKSYSSVWVDSHPCDKVA